MLPDIFKKIVMLDNHDIILKYPGGQQEDGYLERVQVEGSPRSALVALTESGEEIAKSICARLEALVVRRKPRVN